MGDGEARGGSRDILAMAADLLPKVKQCGTEPQRQGDQRYSRLEQPLWRPNCLVDSLSLVAIVCSPSDPSRHEPTLWIFELETETLAE